MTKQYGTVIAHYRPNTSDEMVLEEVITNRIYRRKKIGFDVQPGEHWLDLGANIGAFALYCKLHGAMATCFEPDPDNFTILRMNVPSFACYQMAVTDSFEPSLQFWRGRKAGNNSKVTCLPNPNLLSHNKLPNVHAGCLLDQRFDGVKMDIEGSEGALIDQWLLPRCNKLCMEYHSSRDKSVENLRRRLEILRSKFEIVAYPPEYDRIIAEGYNSSYDGNQLTYFDRMVFCMGAK